MGGVSCFCQLIKEASQSLPPVGGKSNGIIFVRGVYLDENTSQSASVEFVRHRRTNSARSRLRSILFQKGNTLLEQFQETPPGWAASPAFFYQ